VTIWEGRHLVRLPAPQIPEWLNCGTNRYCAGPGWDPEALSVSFDVREGNVMEVDFISSSEDFSTYPPDKPKCYGN
jgi:hypothetical protein